MFCATDDASVGERRAALSAPRSFTQAGAVPTPLSSDLGGQITADTAEFRAAMGEVSVEREAVERQQQARNKRRNRRQRLARAMRGK